MSARTAAAAAAAAAAVVALLAWRARRRRTAGSWLQFLDFTAKYADSIDLSAMEAALAAAPGLMFYFVQCRDDYLRLLRACVDHAAAGGSGPPPIAGADTDGGER